MSLGVDMTGDEYVDHEDETNMHIFYDGTISSNATWI